MKNNNFCICFYINKFIVGVLFSLSIIYFNNQRYWAKKL